MFIHSQKNHKLNPLKSKLGQYQMISLFNSITSLKI